MRAAIVGDVGELDLLDRKSIRVSLDKGQEPRDVEHKNPVRIQFIARLCCTGLELLVEFEFGQAHELVAYSNWWSRTQRSEPAVIHLGEVTMQRAHTRVHSFGAIRLGKRTTGCSLAASQASPIARPPR